MPTLFSKELLDDLLADKHLTPDEVDGLILKQPREDQYLDYKDGLLMQKPKDARHKVRKYVSGFANGEGGTLVLGVSEAPRQISACQRIGNTPLDEWAQSVLVDMAPYFSPQPRLHVVPHPKGEVLIVAVGRAPHLVPCVVSGEAKYYLRMHQSTLDAPPYLISDLVLGRRQHPVLDVKPRDVTFEAAPCVYEAGNLISDGLGLGFAFVVENLSLVTAEQVEIGMVWWTPMDQPARLPRQLQSYIDASERPDSEHFEGMRWRLHHEKGLIHRSSTLRPFSAVWTEHIVRMVVPATPRAIIRCAVYVLPYGSPPTWFELEYDYWGDYRRGDPVMAKNEVMKRVNITPLGAQRPRVTWRTPAREGQA